MIKLQSLHENFINSAERSMFGAKNLPVRPVHDTSQPVIALERWKKVDDTLQKRFLFGSVDARNVFLKGLIEYETDVGHHAKSMNVSQELVELTLSTPNVERITELDKEYARFADVTYKEALLQYNK